MSADQLSALSDSLFSVSIVLYSLAILAYCLELAFGPGSRPAGQREVVVASQIASRLPAGAESASNGLEASTHSSPPDPGSARAAAYGRIAVTLTVAAATCHAGVLVFRGLATRRVPWGNVYEFGTAVALVAVVTLLIMIIRVPGSRRFGVFVVGPVVIGLVLLGLFLYVEAGPLVAALRSTWLAVHVTAATLGFGIFLVSGMASAMWLVRSRFEAGDGAERRFAERLGQRLPSAATLDRVAHRTIVLGFPIWTFAVIAGAIWAESAWGRFWGWDPKETWAFIAWVIYAAYLHARATAGWKDRAAAWINVVGLTAMIFNLLYVNYVSTGLHSYAGVS